MLSLERSILVLAMASLSSAGCASAPALSPMQARQITTRLVEGSREDTFRAVLTVLQDQGYAIRNTDMDAGLIAAYTARRSTGAFGIPSNDQTGFELSCIVGAISERTTEIRLTIRKSDEEDRGLIGRMTDSGPEVYDAEVYQNFFNQITVELKRRQAIAGSG